MGEPFLLGFLRTLFFMVYVFCLKCDGGDFVAGCVAEGGHPNDSHNSGARDNQKPQNSGREQRQKNLVPPHSRSERIRQGMVHVPNQYGSDEKSGRISRSCR